MQAHKNKSSCSCKMSSLVARVYEYEETQGKKSQALHGHRFGDGRPSRNTEQDQSDVGIMEEGYSDNNVIKEDWNHSCPSRDVKQDQGVGKKSGQKIPKGRYLEYFDDEEEVWDSVSTAEDAKPPSPQGAAAAASSGRRPGAYAIGESRRREQSRREGTETLYAADEVAATDAPRDDILPIAAEVAEGNNDADISDQIRRVLEESAVPASSVSKDPSSEESAVQSRRWRRLGFAMFCLLLLVVLVVVVVVVVVAVTLTRDDQLPMTTITVVIQLDDRPEETGWQLHRGDEELVDFPPGTYAGNTWGLVTARTDVPRGQEHTFTIVDSGRDGITNGYYEIYDGPDTSDPSARLVEGSGDFGGQAQHDFVAIGREDDDCPLGYIPDDISGCSMDPAGCPSPPDNVMNYCDDSYEPIKCEICCYTNWCIMEWSHVFDDNEDYEQECVFVVTPDDDQCPFGVF